MREAFAAVQNKAEILHTRHSQKAARLCTLRARDSIRFFYLYYMYKDDNHKDIRCEVEIKTCVQECNCFPLNKILQYFYGTWKWPGSQLTASTVYVYRILAGPRIAVGRATDS